MLACFVNSNVIYAKDFELIRKCWALMQLQFICDKNDEEKRVINQYMVPCKGFVPPLIPLYCVLNDPDFLVMC